MGHAPCEGGARRIERRRALHALPKKPVRLDSLTSDSIPLDSVQSHHSNVQVNLIILKHSTQLANSVTAAAVESGLSDRLKPPCDHSANPGQHAPIPPYAADYSGITCKRPKTISKTQIQGNREKEAIALTFLTRPVEL